LDCREFRERLDRYLAGALDAGEFERMVGHEAGCAACHGLASEALPEAPPAPTAAPGPDFTDEVLRRTVGADCGRIALALAAEVDGPLPAREAEQVVRHVRECPDCRALAHALELLPEAYRALPRLRAGGGSRGPCWRAPARRRPGS
jgi:anti-sigma factor RsiW